MVLIIFVAGSSFGQNQMLYVEGILKNKEGQTLDFKNTIYNSSDSSIYEELKSITVDQTGKWWMNIGEGVVTVNSSVASVDQVDFSSDSLGMSISIDNGAGFVEIANDIFSFIPFSFYARSAADSVLIWDLADMDSSGISLNDVMVYNAPNWNVSGVTAIYALNSANSTYSDTALVVLNYFASYQDSVIQTSWADSSHFTHYADSVSFADTSNFSDTAGYAFDDGSWKRGGNAVIGLSNWIGPSTNNPLEIRTNGVSRIKVDSNMVTIGLPVAGTPSFGGVIDGFMFSGPRDVGTYPAYGGVNHFSFVHDKATVNIGESHDSLIAPLKMGYNNFTLGKNIVAFADYSFAVGENISIENPAIIGDYSFAVGKDHIVAGRYGLAAGRGCEIGFIRNVAMGDSCSAPNGYACIAMGKKCIADGNIEPCIAIGSHIDNSGKYTNAFGWKIKMNKRKGSFVYADYSTQDTMQILAVANNFDRWHARAVGGVGIYSSSDLSTGVYLFPGSGSWSATSSRDSKNILNEVPKLSDNLKRLNVSSWNYKNYSVNHIGPMAQDMKSIFGYGETNVMINSLDIDGLVLSGIKQLDEEISGQIDKLSKELGVSSLGLKK